MTIGSFSYWRKKLQRTKEIKSDGGDDAKPKFSSVNIIPNKPTPILKNENMQKHIEILFPDGIILKLPVSFKKAIIIFALEALEGER